MGSRHRGVRLATLMGTFALLPAGIALAAATNGSYSGATMQTGHPNGHVGFKVSNHKDVKAFSGGISGDCTKSQRPQKIVQISLTPTPDMAIHHGKFGFHGKFNISNGPVVIAKHVDGKIAGQFVTSDEATGTMKFSWTFDSNAPSGFSGYHCTTGTAHFSANHV